MPGLDRLGQLTRRVTPEEGRNGHADSPLHHLASNLGRPYGEGREQRARHTNPDGGVMDDVLPAVSPEWDNPTTTDAPTDEQNTAMTQVYSLSRFLPQWLSIAATGQLAPRRWRELALVLGATLDVVTTMDDDPVVTYTPGTITITSHAFESDRDSDEGRCGRCGMPADDNELHPEPQ